MKLFGPKFEEHFHKKTKLKTESKKLFSKVTYSKHGNNKPFSSGSRSNTNGKGHSPDSERVKYNICRKAKPKATSKRNKNVSEDKKLVDTEVQELLRKRAITPAQGSKDDEYG